MTIHHATIKRAAQAGFVIQELPNGFNIARTDDGWFAGPYATAKEAADAAHNPGTVLLDPGEISIKNRCGVMNAAKHDEYEHNPHGPGCGDTMDIELRNAYTNEKTGLDMPGLRAAAAHLWNPEWELLNPGMQRMNASNRIRAMLRNNKEAVVTIGAKTGRFGVVFDPSTRRPKKAKA